MHARFSRKFATVASMAFALLAPAVRSEVPQFLGLSTRGHMSGANGASLFFTLDASTGLRPVLIACGGPDLVQFGVAGAIADPSLEVWDSTGTMIASNDDRDPALLEDSNYSAAARDPKDAGIRLILGPGAYTVRLRNKAGADGFYLVEMNVEGAGSTLSSAALLTDFASSGNGVGLNFAGAGTLRLALFLSGQGLPLASAIQAPRLDVFSSDIPPVRLSSTTEVTADAATYQPRYHSPAFGNGHGAGVVIPWTIAATAPNGSATVFDGESAGGTGTYLLEVHDDEFTATRSPVIYVSPRPQTVKEDDTLVLQALVSGDVTSATWQRDGVDLATPGTISVAGATTLTLTVPGITAAEAGLYRVRVSTTAGDVVSLPAAVTVSVDPAHIVTSPQSLTIYEGQSATFSATATGSGLHFQWSRNGSAIDGATAASFTLATVGLSDAGAYTVAVTNSLGTVVSAPARLDIQPAPTRLTNLSVLAPAGEGDRTLSMGFNVSGGTKPVIVRAVGPGLATFGLPNLLSNPRLNIYSGSTIILQNDDWSGDDGHALGAFALVPGSKDALIAASFTPGLYSAEVKGVGGTTGQAIVELYDADTAPTVVRVTNLSTRAQVDDGQRLIVGFTLSGSTAKTMVMRAVGPSLALFGVGGAHPDPQLELFQGNTLLDSNDQWQGDDGRAVGAFQLAAGSKDAVLVKRLAPGSYSVHALGAAGTSGVVLVELYEGSD